MKKDSQMEVIVNENKLNKIEIEQEDDSDLLEYEKIQCFNCTKYFDPSIYGMEIYFILFQKGIDIQDENDFNKNKDTFSCEECYYQLHFPFYPKKDILLQLNNVQPNIKYEFNMVLQDFYNDSCILGVFLSKQDLINVFKKRNNQQNFIINTSINGKEPTNEGSNYFLVESDDITLMQNKVNFECNNFSFDTPSLNELLLMNNVQKSQLLPSSNPIVFTLFHCKQIRVSAYTSKLYKKKFWNCLNHEYLFKVFEEQEQIYKKKTINKDTYSSYLKAPQNGNGIVTSALKMDQEISQKNSILMSQITQQEKRDTNEVYLRIKNFHQIFPFMYQDQMVVKMDDDAVIQYPAYTYHHNHPFDIRDFCYINSINPTWLCPICNKHKVFLKEIQLDFYLFALIQTQFLKDTQLSLKIKNILENKPKFDYQFFQQQVGNIKISSISLKDQPIQDKENESVTYQNLQLDKREDYLSRSKNFSNITTIIKPQQEKCRSSIEYNQRNQNPPLNIMKSEFKNKKCKTSDSYNENESNHLGGKCLSITYQDILDDYEEYLAYLNPFQKSQGILYKGKKDNSLSAFNSILNDKPLENDSNEMKSKKSSRVYGKLINRSKSKTISQNSTDSNKESIKKEQSNDHDDTANFLQEKIEIEEPINSDFNNQHFSCININDISKKMNFDLQVQEFSDLNEKQILEENKILEVSNDFYLETSFLRSPLEINILFDSSYLLYNCVNKELISIAQLIENVDFQEDQYALEKIFNTDILQSHHFIFNLFNLSLVSNCQYQLLLQILQKNPSTKVYFETLVSIQKQFTKFGKNSAFYELLGDFYAKMISNKEKRMSNINPLAISVNQQSNQGNLIQQKKIYLEKLIECILGMALFKQQNLKDYSVIDIFQQMILEYLAFKNSTIPVLMNIYNILINYFSNQCSIVLIKIKESLKQQGISI